MSEQKSESANVSDFIDRIPGTIRWGLVLSALIAVIPSTVIFFFLDQSIQSTRALILENGDRIGRVEARLQKSLAQQATSLDRVKDDVDAIRLFLATSDKDGAELSLSPNVQEYPYDRLGLGGVGPERVPDFFTFSIGLPFAADTAVIEAEKSELSVILRRALIADDRFDYSDLEHEIEVYESYYFPEESDNPRLELVAVAVFRTTKP